MCTQCGCWTETNNPGTSHDAGGDQSPKGVPVTTSPLAKKGK